MVKVKYDDLSAAFDFVSFAAPFFRRRGAYARFKELLAAEGCLEKWYAFEAESTERALGQWCEANGFHFTEDDSQGSA